jgi:hypothetical protein
MYRRLFRFAVTALTILTANLLTVFIAELLISHRWEYKPLRFTLVSMAIITIVFYPLFLKMEEWLNNLSRKFIKAGHSYVGKFIGLILTFAAGLFILMFFYARMWYNINVFELLLNGRLFSLF